jgi:hypothetical protein
MGRPATGETPSWNVRVPKAVWDEAKQLAAAEGHTVSDWINTDLRRRIAAARRRQAREQPPE